MIALLAKSFGQTPEQVSHGLACIDRDARIDVNDIRHQIAWFREQGLVKSAVDADAILDKRYIVPLP